MEESIIKRAKEFIAKHKISKWGKDAHCWFLITEIKRFAKEAWQVDMTKEQGQELFKLLSVKGLGGNASQMRQALGFKADDSIADDMWE
jgi:hypothetical protein